MVKNMWRSLLILLGMFFFTSCGSNSPTSDFRIAMDPEWNTLQLPERQAALQAFSTELIEAIAKEQKTRFVLYDRSWDNLVQGLKENKYDGILSLMQPYLFYEKMYDFSDICLHTGPTLVVPISANIKSLEDLNGKEVAVQQNSNAALMLEKYPEILQRTYSSVPQAFNDLLRGSIDGVMVDILTAAAYCSDLYQGKLKIAFPPLTQEGIRLVTLHDKSPEAIQIFNEGLRALKEKGTYAKLTKKWNLIE